MAEPIRWEYKAVIMSPDLDWMPTDAEAVSKQITEVASRGWELVTSNGVMLIFKREAR